MIWTICQLLLLLLLHPCSCDWGIGGRVGMLEVGVEPQHSARAEHDSQSCDQALLHLSQQRKKPRRSKRSTLPGNPNAAARWRRSRWPDFAPLGNPVSRKAHLLSAWVCFLLKGRWHVNASWQRQKLAFVCVAALVKAWPQTQPRPCSIFVFTCSSSPEHSYELRTRSWKVCVDVCDFFLHTPTDIKNKVTERFHVSIHTSSCTAVAAAASKLCHVTPG